MKRFKEYTCFVPLVVFLIGFTIEGFAQQDITVIARSTHSSIKLRWAPTSSLVWELGNRYGYTIERYTILKDSLRVTPAEQNLLVTPVLKPLEKAQWEPLVDQDDYAAIVAQAIYGETFELTESFDKDIFQVAKKTQERDQRFSFALFACDQSFNTAKLAGVGYTDDTVVEGEKYLYKVYANIPRSIVETDTAVSYIGLEDKRPLPQIQEFKAEFSDKQVALSWDKTLTDRFYNAFWIEKSVDGGETFQSITNSPIINAYSEDKSHTGTYFKLDTLTQNNREVSYRVRGVNPFGEKGPFSEVVSGKGRPTITAFATITAHQISKSGAASLQWEYPKNQEKLIQGFRLKVGRTPKGPFKAVTKELISKNERGYTITNPIGTGYYRIALLAEGAELNPSFPYLVQLEDSIPPAIPKNIQASIDPQGKVSLTWDQNEEADFWGYRVFRSNFKSAEFSEVTTDPLPSSTFEESIALDNLTEQVYYQVVAVDTRDNRSEASERVKVVKPDIVPPAAPVFKKVEGLESGVLLRWAPSSSEDVVGHRVYRAVRGSSQWALIAVLDSIPFFLDTAVQANQPHLYTILAVDDAGLESAPAKPVRMSRKVSKTSASYEGFSGRSERENNRIVLFWRLTGEAIRQVKVYRAVDGAPISWYRTIENTGQQFVDENVVQNVTYQYQLKLVLDNGLEVGFSERVEVKF